jgi:hypothetical protein
VLILSWGFLLVPDRELLYWEAPIHLIFGLSTFIPIGFLGFFFLFLYPSTCSAAAFVFLQLGLEGG